jgi:hypothetical protein
LNDPHPDVRREVCDGLARQAETGELGSSVLKQGERALAGNDWRGLEQALRLLTRLDQKQHAERFYALLEHPRPEVYVTAAYGLRRLAVEATFQKLLQFARGRYEARLQLWESPLSMGLDEQLSQIIQLFGQVKYKPADSFLRTFVPKQYDLDRSRAAAIWALGHFYEAAPEEDLAAQLEERVRDIVPPEPELEIVRRFAAVSLGRMQARQALPTLRSFSEGSLIETEAGYACAWAASQITGEPFEPPQARLRYRHHFFLEPTRRPTDSRSEAGR